MRISDWSSDVCSSYLWADSALLTSRAAAPCLFHEELLAHIPTRGAGRPCRAALRRLFPDSAGGADHPRHPVQRRGGAGDRHGLLDHLQRRRGPALARRAGRGAADLLPSRLSGARLLSALSEPPRVGPEFVLTFIFPWSPFPLLKLYSLLSFLFLSSSPP